MVSHPLLQQVLQLTEQIRQAAQAEDWDASTSLVQQRQPLLEQTFQAEVHADELAALASVIREVDHEVTAMVTAARDLTLTQLQDHRQKSVALRAYAAAQPQLD